MKHPLHLKEITPEWLAFVLKNNRIKSVQKELIGGSKGFLSSVVRVKIEYDHFDEKDPKSLIVKIEPEEESLQQLGNELHAFVREIRFYKEVAEEAPIRLPKLYFSVDEPPAYCMVMEDLSDYISGDQIKGMGENQVLVTLEEIGKLQAKYWSNAQLDKLSWMPTESEMLLDYEEKWDSFAKHFHTFVDSDGLEVGRRLKDSMPWLRKELKNRPKTIVHQDLREDNLLFGDPDTVLILDWQLAMRSMGAFDVARLVGGSERRKERQEHRFEELRRWYDTLIERGVEGYTWEEAIYDYRLGALALLGYPVHFHHVGIGATGRALALFKVMFRRIFSLAVEINAASIL